MYNSNDKHNYPKKSCHLVLFFICLKVILSCFINLGNDESYYWSFAKQLQWNYFDHPPMVAVWVRLFSANLLLEDYVLFLRMGSIVGCATASFFIYKTLTAISTQKAGFTGVFLYNVSLYTSITAGMLVMPDAPQMVFFTAAMYSITQIFNDKIKWQWWIFFGIMAGLCIMSKVHGVFLWGGVFLYAIFYKRVLFKTPAFYAAIAVTAVIVSPILFWNIQNNFITYRFHSERVVVNKESVFHFMGLLREIVGQLIINNPLNVGLALYFFSKNFSEKAKAPLQIFKLIGIPLLLTIFCIALFNNTLPHWSGPAYVALIPTAAIGLSEISFTKYKAVIVGAGTYMLLAIIFIVVAVNFYAGSFSNITGQQLGKNDISLDAYGWKEGGEKFQQFYIEQHHNKKPPLVCNTWWGAHDEYYFARSLGIKMIGLGPVLNIHQYAWRLAKDSININMDTAYALVHSYDYFDAKAAFKNFYSKIDSVQTIPISRRGKNAYNFYIWRLTGWKNHFTN